MLAFIILKLSESFTSLLLCYHICDCFTAGAATWRTVMNNITEWNSWCWEPEMKRLVRYRVIRLDKRADVSQLNLSHVTKNKKKN